jgi:putative heme iron utilization protein
MFKVYVRRDKARELIAEQVARFDTLRVRCSEAAEASS